MKPATPTTPTTSALPRQLVPYRASLKLPTLAYRWHCASLRLYIGVRVGHVIAYSGRYGQ